MSISVLNNSSALVAQNSLANSQAKLQTVLNQLSTGNRLINSSIGAADVSISAGLNANITALNQSASNATNGVNQLQTADGALSQVTTLLNRAVTLATEASTGSLSTQQMTALDTEYQSILTEINTIGSTTNFNGTSVFNGGTGTTLDVFTSDGTTAGSTTIATAISGLSATALGLATTSGGTTTNTKLDAADAKTTLTAITAAIDTVSANRGAIGAAVNQITAGGNVESTEATNLQNSNNAISNTDVAAASSQLTQFQIQQQIGFSALAQTNQSMQSILKLFQ